MCLRLTWFKAMGSDPSLGEHSYSVLGFSEIVSGRTELLENPQTSPVEDGAGVVHGESSSKGRAAPKSNAF